MTSGRRSQLYTAVKRAVEADLTAQGTPPLVLCHISHVYETDASLYFTVAAKELDDGSRSRSRPSAPPRRHRRDGASITHHHAVSRDHKPWLVEEIGPVGVEVLRAVKARLDPASVLNPGVLIP